MNRGAERKEGVVWGPSEEGRWAFQAGITLKQQVWDWCSGRKPPGVKAGEAPGRKVGSTSGPEGAGGAVCHLEISYSWQQVPEGRDHTCPVPHCFQSLKGGLPQTLNKSILNG